MSTSAGPAADGTCVDRVKAIKTTFQVLGVVVGISFALQGIVIFVGPAWGQQDRPLDDFWDACHWASEGALCVIVGLSAVAFELRACCHPKVFRHVAQFAANRVGLAFVYLWLGCYSCGGRIHEGGAGWQLLGQITGITAWLVCIEHLIMSCCIEAQTSQDKVQPESPNASLAGSQRVVARAEEVPKVQYASPQMCGAPVLPEISSDEKPMQDLEQGSEPAPQAEQESPHRWNSMGMKPFGSG